MPFVIFWIKKWMHSFHGLCQYPFCSIILLILIFLCKLHSLLLQQCYTCHVHFLALNLKTDFLLLEFLVRFGQSGDNQWELLLNILLNRVNSSKTSIPSVSLAIILFYFYDHFFYCFIIPMIRTMACYLYSFWFYWFFSFFKFVVNFPDWFLLLFSLNFYFSQFGLGYSSCTSF